MSHNPEGIGHNKLVSELINGATSDNPSDPHQPLHPPPPPNPYPIIHYSPDPRTASNFHQELSHLPPNNSRNHFPIPKTAPNHTFNIYQTQDFESPSLLLFEFEQSIKTLESMKLTTIMMSIQSINKQFNDTIVLLQNRLFTSTLSDLEKKSFEELPYRIWNICIELTNEYPEGYDLDLNEFGLFAVVLDEMIKNSCISTADCVQAQSSLGENELSTSKIPDNPIAENDSLSSFMNLDKSPKFEEAIVEQACFYEPMIRDIVSDSKDYFDMDFKKAAIMENTDKINGAGADEEILSNVASFAIENEESKSSADIEIEAQTENEEQKFSNELSEDEDNNSTENENRENEDHDGEDNQFPQSMEYKDLIGITAVKGKKDLSEMLKVDPHKVTRLSLSKQLFQKAATLIKECLHHHQFTRSHVCKARELIHLSSLPPLLSTSLAMKHRSAQELSPGTKMKTCGMFVSLRKRCNKEIIFIFDPGGRSLISTLWTRLF